MTGAMLASRSCLAARSRKPPPGRSLPPGSISRKFRLVVDDENKGFIVIPGRAARREPGIHVFGHSRLDSGFRAAHAPRNDRSGLMQAGIIAKKRYSYILQS